MAEGVFGVDAKYEIRDELWNKIESLLPDEKPKKKSGRPRMDDRQALTAMLYVLRTGCQWNALPRSLGASSTVHDRFRQWVEDEFFQRLWQAGLAEYDTLKGLDWEWQSIDGAMTKAPLGGKRYRAKSNRSRQERNEEKRADRGCGDSHRGSGGGCQSP